MTKKLQYRLGLDLGVSSIGSAVIKIDDDGTPLDIVDAGVRIFDVSEGAKDRREQRTARKNNERTKKRLEKLGLVLCDMGFWEYKGKKVAEGTKKIRSADVYKLRNRAIAEKIQNLHYIGRIFMHLAKHRGAGYISAQQDIEQNNSKNDPYTILPARLEEDDNLQTIGQYFYKRRTDTLYSPHKHIRQRKQGGGFKNESEVDYAIPRYLVKDEFNKIWAEQSKHYDCMTDDAKQRIYNILFYEHPHMPHAIGKCIYIEKDDRLATAHPLSEKRRIYTAVHNIRIEQKTDKRKLEKAEIDTVIRYITQGNKGNAKEIKKILHLSSFDEVILTDAKQGIKPYLYATKDFKKLPKLAELSESELIEVIDFISNPVDENDWQEPKRLLNEDRVIKWLQNRYDGADSEWGKFLTALPKGRGNLGETATHAIIQGFMDSKDATSERRITDALAKSDERYMSIDDRMKKYDGQYDLLPYYGEILSYDTQPIHRWMQQRNKSLNPDEVEYGKVANPAVHMMLNQLRLVVNDIIHIYGKPAEIHIEVGREVGKSAEEREKEMTRQKSNEDANIEIDAELLNTYGLRPTHKNREKLKLCKQQKNTDVYTLKPISAKMEGYEVEHLIPKALGGTDTMANKCLVNANDNKNKGDEYPFEYFLRTKTEEERREILEFARNELPKNKKWRFEPNAKEIFEEMGDPDETNRYMTDTSYFSKLAMRYLRPIIKQDTENKTPPILAVRGNHTSDLRVFWNLLGVEYDLRGWNEKYPRFLPCYWINEETGERTETKPSEQGWIRYDKKRNPEWIAKPRIDHRHHALDAIVVGLISRSLMQRMTVAYQEGENVKKFDGAYMMNGKNFPDPIQSMSNRYAFRKYVVNKLQKIYVSHRPNRKKQGQLHKATGKTVLYVVNDRQGNTTGYVTKYMRPLEDIFTSKASLEKEFSLSNNIKKVKHDIDFNFDTEQQKYDMWRTSIKKYWNKAVKKLESEKTELESEQQRLAPQADHLKQIKNKSDAEKQMLKDVQKTLRQRPTTPNEKNIIVQAIAITQQQSNKKMLDTKIAKVEFKETLVYIPKHGLGYDGGGNHRMDVYMATTTNKKGDAKQQIKGEIISRYNANDKNFTAKWKRLKDNKLLYTLCINDMLEMYTPQIFKDKEICNTKRCLVKITSISDERIVVCLHTDAGNDDMAKVNKNKVRNKYRYPKKETDLSPQQKDTLTHIENDMKRTTFRARISTFSSHNARKIELTPFGKIKRKHKVLKT